MFFPSNIKMIDIYVVYIMDVYLTYLFDRCLIQIPHN